MLAIVDNSTAIFHIALVLAALLAVCIICLVLALYMRRWVKDAGPAARQEGGFTLSDLRQMHRSGQLSSEEFERAKEKIVAAARRTLLPAEKPARTGGTERQEMPTDPPAAPEGPQADPAGDETPSNPT